MKKFTLQFLHFSVKKNNNNLHKLHFIQNDDK